jgi:hypothetical protein
MGYVSTKVRFKQLAKGNILHFNELGAWCARGNWSGMGVREYGSARPKPVTHRAMRSRTNRTG